MANMSSMKQLKMEVDRLQRQFSTLDAAIAAFANVYSGMQPRKRTKMSNASRAKIAAGQRRRWAKVKAKRKVLRSE